MNDIMGSVMIFSTYSDPKYFPFEIDVFLFLPVFTIFSEICRPSEK